MVIEASLSHNPAMRARPLFFAAVLTATGALTPAVSAESTLVFSVEDVSASYVPHLQPRHGGNATFVKGDYYVDRGSVQNPYTVTQFGKKGGAVVGRYHETTTVTSATAWSRAGGASLPGGTLRYSGHGEIRRGALSGTTRVTGGTDRFAGARGTITGGTLAQPLLTYHLKLR